MLVTNKLKMDLTAPDPSLSVNAVQGDAYSRSLRIALYSNVVPWIIPEGITAAVRYIKPDHTKGYYDTLPDGSNAWNIQENNLTVRLAPQMLTVPGKVKAQIELIHGTHILSTFSLIIHVEPNPAAGVLKSEDYINWLKWFQEQTEEHVSHIQHSAQNAIQASQSAILALEQAATSADNAEIAADIAKLSSSQAIDAAAAASACQKKTEAIAENVSVIVARNEAYTKYESDCRYSPSIVASASGKFIGLHDSTSNAFKRLKIFGKTTQNGAPTPEAPIPLETVGESVSVTVCGKNLLKIEFDQKTSSGVVFSPGEDGNVGLSGVSDGYGFAKVASVYLQEGISYYASMKEATPGTLNIRVIDRTVNPVHAPMSGVGAFTVNKSGLYDFEITTGPTFKGPVACYPQLEIGSVATEYEPYNEQILSISTPNGLPGIPVTSGGNYTDENGQQWVCDEVDFEKDVYVQRVEHIILDGSSDETWVATSGTDTAGIYRNVYTGISGKITEQGCLCNRYPAVTPYDTYAKSTGIAPDINGFLNIYDPNYNAGSGTAWREFLQSNPINCLVCLATPNETPLPNEEITFFTAMHTNYPNTTIFNGEGADMEVNYVADTKLYIDKKFDQLASAMLSN